MVGKPMDSSSDEGTTGIAFNNDDHLHHFNTSATSYPTSSPPPRLNNRLVREERKKVLKMSVRKLRQIEDPETSLCRSVLINNTMRRIQYEMREEKANAKKFTTPYSFMAAAAAAEEEQNGSCGAKDNDFDDSLTCSERLRQPMEDDLICHSNNDSGSSSSSSSDSSSSNSSDTSSSGSSSDDEEETDDVQSKTAASSTAAAAHNSDHQLADQVVADCPEAIQLTPQVEDDEDDDNILSASDMTRRARKRQLDQVLPDSSSLPAEKAAKLDMVTNSGEADDHSNMTAEDDDDDDLLSEVYMPPSISTPSMMCLEDSDQLTVPLPLRQQAESQSHHHPVGNDCTITPYWAPRPNDQQGANSNNYFHHSSSLVTSSSSAVTSSATDWSSALTSSAQSPPATSASVPWVTISPTTSVNSTLSLSTTSSTFCDSLRNEWTQVPTTSASSYSTTAAATAAAASSATTHHMQTTLPAWSRTTDFGSDWCDESAFQTGPTDNKHSSSNSSWCNQSNKDESSSDFSPEAAAANCLDEAAAAAAAVDASPAGSPESQISSDSSGSEASTNGSGSSSFPEESDNSQQGGDQHLISCGQSSQIYDELQSGAFNRMLSSLVTSLES